MQKNKLISVFIFGLLVFSLMIFSPLSVNAEPICEQGERRCNTRVVGYLQECKNCDKDDDLEWCNIKNCAEDDQVCVDSSCQGNITCTSSGQLTGDLNADGRINDLDAILIKYVIDGEINQPEDLCCIDMNNDGIIDEFDSTILDNIFAGREAIPGSCPIIEEPKEVIKTVCTINNVCEKGENIDNCPTDCTIEKDKGIINRTTIFIAIFLVIILVVVYLIFNNKKSISNNKDLNKPQ